MIRRKRLDFVSTGSDTKVLICSADQPAVHQRSQPLRFLARRLCSPCAHLSDGVRRSRPCTPLHAQRTSSVPTWFAPALNPVKPRRRSVTPAAIQICVLAAGAIIAVITRNYAPRAASEVRAWPRGCWDQMGSGDSHGYVQRDD
jgi:hypothetical protein